MLDKIRGVAQGWVGKALLALITIPFALFGIDSYLNQASKNIAVAKVNDSEISVQEYGIALQNVRSRLQEEQKLDPAQLDSPEVKQLVLDQLIYKRLVDAEIKRSHFVVSDEQLTTYVTGMPEFQKDGKFSQERYDELLKQNGMQASQFEASMRADMLAQQVSGGVSNLSFVPDARANSIYHITNQKRVVSVAEVKTKDFIKEAQIKPEAVRAYYEQHKDKLLMPEQVKLEFLVFSASNFVPAMQVSEDDVKRHYDENSAKMQGNEQRRASHILIGFGAKPTPEAKKQAREKAEALLAELKKSPAKFAEIAKKESQDPGSAAKGGDLGSFARGAMVKPFEDAAFSMQVGEMSGIVESEYGYHIIKLTEVSGESADFEKMKPQIKADLMYQKAVKAFTEQAENFGEKVYAQSESLAPAAKAFNLEVQKTEWMSRADALKFFKENQKFVEALFSNEVLKERRNTEAIEVSPNNMVSARVVDYRPATPKTFDEVKAGIEELLKLEAASKLALAKGEAALKSLNAGQNVEGLDWIPEVTVDRKSAEGLTEVAMRQVFKTNTSKLPAYSGVADDKKGFLLVKVLKVEAPSADEEPMKNAKLNLNDALASEYVTSYKQSLKNKAKVVENKQLLSSAAAE